MAAMRKTSNGRVEISTRYLQLLILIGSLVGGVLTLTASAVRKNDQLKSAVADTTFRAHVTSESTRIAGVELAVQALRYDVQRGQEQSHALACYTANYPAGLCDDLKLVKQAGAPR